ncbi:hypothetical protein PYK79_03470 [Streptomyces sp. ID05-04B]|uniref:hypothetical protein n=1 Tax=Streptomyces sp. ID05-04B TaxID=3028661 RepID=UPI0029C586EC|nr:hypothetical protein [Streptomyces sp. ID05-04B]MDX5562746.1 hypothetical protein [Streptomyces sp. ID05-04B]MDX5562763.1 hypothetical protein [Streptomyces sp. ID05-04B]
MPIASETAVTAGDTTHPVTAATVRAAAARLTPADSADPHPNRSWYALVGTHLYYVVDLIAEATGTRDVKVKTARLRLAELGFPVFALAWSTLLTQGHPGHTG